MEQLLDNCPSHCILGSVMHLFVDVSALLRRLQVSLDLAELGQVEGGDLLGLLDLLLVALHLVLQLVHQLLHTLVVLQQMCVSRKISFINKEKISRPYDPPPERM